MMLFKRSICYLMITVFLMTTMFADLEVAGEAAAKTGETANIVVFVDFSDVSHTHTSSTTSDINNCFKDNFQNTLNLFDGSDSKPLGMAKYISTISYGQLKVNNIFPQNITKDTGKSITPYKLSNGADYYKCDESATIDTMIAEVIKNLQSAGLSSGDIDKDNDGCVDNLTIVVECEDQTSNSNKNIYGAKFSYTGRSSSDMIGGKYVNNVCVLPEQGVYFKYGLQGSGLIIHEFLHSLGYPDLYRAGTKSGSPVGMWDIMSTQSYKVQYPLAYLRSEYTGWFDIPEVSTDQTNYTIYSASAATSATKNNQALILKTNYSDTEFFVVEYRQRSTSENTLEQSVHGSGLIIYRVNTAYETNHLLNTPDMIYVFRPGDTYNSYGYESGDVDALGSSFLSKESGRTSYGTSDMSANITGDAITYSDGTNSGIVISNVGSAAGDTISFDVKFTNSENDEYWKTACSNTEGATSVASCMDDSGNIYVLSNKSSGADVYKFSNGGLVQVGSTISDGVRNTRYEICSFNNTLYAAYYTSDYKVKLVKLNGSSWETVYTAAYDSNDSDSMDMCSDSKGIYLTYTNGGNTVYATAIYGASFLDEKVMSLSSAYNPSICAENGNIAIAVRDFMNSSAAHVAYYNSSDSSWKEIDGSGSIQYSEADTEMKDNVIYLVKKYSVIGTSGNTYDNNIYSCDMSASNPVWKQVGSNKFADNAVSDFGIGFNGNVPYIAYNEGDTKTVTNTYAKSLINGKWTSLGVRVSTDTANGLNVFSYGSNVYVIYCVSSDSSGNGGNIYIKYHTTNANSQGVNPGYVSGEEGSDTGSDYDFGLSDDLDTGNGDDKASSNPEAPSTPGTSDTNTDNSTSNSTSNSTDNAALVQEVTVSYSTHIQSFGWESSLKSNGEVSGTSGLSKRLEAIKISVSGNSNLGIQYTTHCQTYGWLPWSSNGDMSGTEGLSKRLEAIKIQLTGSDKDKYDVYYRVHAQSYGWLNWAKNGEAAGTAGYAKRLEAIQIVVVRKSDTAPALSYGGVTSTQTEAYAAKAGTSSAASGENTTNVAYRTHVQSYGWQGWRYNGTMSGTSGEGKRLEAINIKLTNQQYSGGIRYKTHIQGIGWQDWRQDGELSGTSGQAKRLEAIEIELTGEMADQYDVYYRVHAQSYGWLAWAKNGEASGTAGYGKRLEGIQIVIVPKGSAAPDAGYGGVISAQSTAYIQK